MTREGLAALAVGAAAAVAVALGLLTVGLPGEARRERLDERRLEDLAAIIAEAGRHAEAHDGALPQTLEEIGDRLPAQRSLRDPVTGEPYAYEAAGPGRYRLCAEFDSAGPHELPPRIERADPPRLEPTTVTGHGRQCFALIADGAE